MVNLSYYFGFDFGMRCIGVAVGQMASCHANPLVILKAKQGVPDWIALDKLCQEWMVKGFVVGLAEGDHVPKHFQAATKKFAQALQDRYQLPCHFVDEHYTTVEAKKSTHYKGSQDGRLDDIAAAIILQKYLDNYQTQE
jgi:putative Holliday junction resolvase